MNEACDFSMFANEMAPFSKTGYFKVNLCDDSCYANDEWYNCFGAEPGMRIVDVLKQFPYVHPVDHYSLGSFLENAKRGYEKKYMGYMRVRIPGRDVAWKWYQVHMMVTKFAPEENVVEVLGTHYDVSAFMGDDDQQMGVMSHMSDLLQSFNTIPWTFDFRTNIIISNRSFVDRKYGFNAASKQMSWDEFMTSIMPEFSEEMNKFKERIHSGTSARGVIEVQMRLGEKLVPTWVEFRAIAQEYDEQGHVSSAVGTITIIQERKEAEMAMRDAQLKAEHANQVKTSFLANMSHEFRTPLNSILGFSTILAHSDTIEERMQCLGAIQNSGSMLVQIIEDVIEFSQIEAGEIVLRNDRINLTELINNVVEECKPSRKAGVEMYINAPEEPIQLHGDEQKIKLVLKHLIGNASKYTDKGSVTTNLSHNDEYAIIAISDTGRGMNKDSIDHIFDRFYKGSTYIPGTGLGLSIVKHLIDMWKGTVRVESEIGKGTTFTFTIPIYSSFG